MITPSDSVTEYPSRTITIVVSCAEGGGTPDTTCRLVAEKLSDHIGTPVKVKNVPGAGGLLATTEVARATPDGYTLLFATNSAICFTPLLYKQPSYNPMLDLTPLVMLGSNPFVLAVSAELPVHSVADLIVLAKRKPKQLSFGSFGMGTSRTFMELFMKEAGLELIHVPNPGSAARVLEDVQAGIVQMSFVDPKVIVDNEFPGVRYIGLSTKTRHPAVPDIPTIAESGLPTYDANSWVSLVAPAQTPPEALKKLRIALQQIVASTEFKKYLANNGFVALDILTIEEMSKFFESEINKWGKVLRSAGMVGTQ